MIERIVLSSDAPVAVPLRVGSPITILDVPANAVVSTAAGVRVEAGATLSAADARGLRIQSNDNLVLAAEQLRWSEGGSETSVDVVAYHGSAAWYGTFDAEKIDHRGFVVAEDGAAMSEAAFGLLQYQGGAQLDGYAYLSGYSSPLSDSELYRFSWEGGFELVADIAPGTGSSFPNDFVRIDDNVYFEARQEAGGTYVLMRVDGDSTVSTVLGPDGGVLTRSHLLQPVVLDGRTHIRAVEAGGPAEVYRIEADGSLTAMDRFASGGPFTFVSSIFELDDQLYAEGFDRSGATTRVLDDGEWREVADVRGAYSNLTDFAGAELFVGGEGESDIMERGADGSAAGWLDFLGADLRVLRFREVDGRLVVEVLDEAQAYNSPLRIQLWSVDASGGAERLVPTMTAIESANEMDGTFFFVARDADGREGMWQLGEDGEAALRVEFSGDLAGARLGGTTLLDLPAPQGTAANDLIVEGAGDDTVHGHGGDDTIMGGLGDDVLHGGDGRDELRGGAGGDALIGGAGRDTASYSDSMAGLTIDLANDALGTGDAAGDSYLGIENLAGSAFADSVRGDDAPNLIGGLGGDDQIYGRGGNDILRGDRGDDRLFGQTGDDALIGGAGADVLNGGAGADRASYIDTQPVSGTGVRADLALAGTNTGDAAGDSYISIEGIDGSRGADFLGGDGGANLLYGFGGADVLAGRAGADTLFGQNGDDELRGGAGADVLVGGTGRDAASYADAAAGVSASFVNASYNTGDAAGDSYFAMENLIGSAFGDLLTGNAAANRIEGLGGDDVLDGRAGNDVLRGDAGDDVLIGSAGADFLVGGAGADEFRYSATGESTGASRDNILDFTRGTDLIDLARIDADSTVAGNQAFTFVGTSAFSSTAGELRATNGLVEADTNGDGAADLTIAVNGLALASDDFVF